MAIRKEWLNVAASKTSNRYFSNIQEKKIAKAVGGRKTANSGATKFSFTFY